MLEAAITFNLTSITNFSTLFHHRISVVISNSRKWYKRGQCNQGEQERYSGHNIGSLGSNRSVLNHSEPCRVEGRFCSENMSFYLRNVWFANFAKNLVFREGHRRRRHLTPILAARKPFQLAVLVAMLDYRTPVESRRVKTIQQFREERPQL
jgi:hypothetical protein